MELEKNILFLIVFQISKTQILRKITMYEKKVKYACNFKKSLTLTKISCLLKNRKFAIMLIIIQLFVKSRKFETNTFVLLNMILKVQKPSF